MSKAWSKDIWVDPHTFGGTLACEVLADMLNQNVVSIYEKHRVLAFLNMSASILKASSSISDLKFRENVLLIVRNDLLNKIDNMEHSVKILSYMKNVVHHYYRKNLTSSSELIIV